MPTKLVQWLLGGCAFVCLWLALVYDLVPVELTPMGRHVIYFLPLYAVGLFVLATFFIIAYRVLTFNDCPEAHAQLAKEIEAAQADLATRGFLIAAAYATGHTTPTAKATKAGGKRS